MSTNTATLIVAENAAAANANAELIARLVARGKEYAAAFAAAMRELLTKAEGNESELRKLYRLSAASDSVSPELAEALRGGK